MRGVRCSSLCVSCFEQAESIVTEDFYAALNLGRPFVIEGLMDRVPFDIYRDRMISVAWSFFRRCTSLLLNVDGLDRCDCGNRPNLMISFCQGDWLCTQCGEQHQGHQLELFMPEILKLRNRGYWARSEGSDDGNSRPVCRYLGDATILRNAGLFTEDHSVQGRSEYVPRRLQRSRVSGLSCWK